ncbi:Putative amino-acid ABC transporter-binding protein YhdW [Seminavis robusta]|uniref:Amino-acid ABC transporter-binding protein YhdW n=1 Tax=Seminavis robusta TaxID=568900 RepID=A0A9N8EHX4_9STRA|nr:Putative amino-acid ABC transporter-binding protein YhdW [Seminavis robusta]|eukprot:Sro1105_g241930.1 Putative amino-acid ABC transporter-binding protein YhdW (833) ;mRNA; f:19237-21930
MSDNPSNKLKGPASCDEENMATGRTENSSSEQEEREAETLVVAEGKQTEEVLFNILDQKIRENAKPITISNPDSNSENRGENGNPILETWEAARADIEPLPSQPDSSRRRLMETAPGAYAVPGQLSIAASSGNELPGDETAVAPDPTPDATTTVSAFLSPAENEHSANSDSHRQAVGELVVHASPDEDGINQENAKKQKAVGFVAVLLLLVVIVLLVMGLAGTFDSKTDDKYGNAESGTANNSPHLVEVNDTAVDVIKNLRFSKTLKKIKSEGILHCPFHPIAGYMFANLTTGDADGIHTAVCRAIGSAIFGAGPLPSGFSNRNKRWTVNATVGSKFEEKYKDFNETFPRIEWVDLTPVWTGNRGLSQILMGIGYSMERHTYEHYLKFGLSFTQPYSFEGAYISGDPFYVECFVDKGFKHTQECQDLSICTNMGSSYYTFLSGVIPDRRIRRIQFYTDAYPMFVNASCNLIIHSAGERARDVVLNQYGYKGNFTTSGAVFNKEPIGVGTFKGDPVWDDFVNAVVQSLISAEVHGITKATAHLFPQTDVFGEDFRDMFRNAIGAVGNFAEIYEEHLQQAIPREAVNTINSGDAGLLFTAPLGTQKLWSNFTLGRNIQRVLERGRLLCGVRLGRPGFATGKHDNGTTFAGMDIDFCKAVAASMFGGDTQAVDYIELNSSYPSDGYVKLAAGEVDMVAGAAWNLANDVKEPGTGIGFAFSQPYFYGYSAEEDNLCLASMQDDQVWSTYLYWVVGCTIYAEQEGIGQTNSTEMPLIYAFGEGFQRMFRDIVFAVGSYKEMYSRNIEPTIPRSVHRRNSLNYGSSSGPQLYPMPGFV